MEPAEYYHACLELLRPEADSGWKQIEKAYHGRAYHNLDHLREMIAYLPERAGAHAPEERRWAIFGMALIYHDIVYRAGSQHNEKRSADLAEKALRVLGASAPELSYCRRLIMATKTHLPEGADPEDQALLIDLDLAVLGRDQAGYDAYAKAVREEFRRYPDFLYRPGRRKALRHFLERPFIYHTPAFRERFESTARENIKREMQE